MPLRRSAPVKFTGVGLSDNVDATNAGRGVMKTLTNMLPNPTTKGTWVSRPGAVDLINFVDAGYLDPGFISGYETVGDIVYGLISTMRLSGHDEPFAYDLAAGAFLPVVGITSLNVPVSPPTTGLWVPPQLEQVGARVIVTHTGFDGDTVKFGWFDVSEADIRITVDYLAGQPFLYGGFSLLGAQPGLLVSGSVDIPADAFVVDVYPDTQSVNYFTGTSHGTDIIDGIPGLDMIEMYPGKIVTGPGAEDGRTIIGTPTGVSIQLNQPTDTSVVGGQFKVAGNIPSTQPYTYNGDFTAGSKDITNVGPVTTDLHTGQQVNNVNVLPGTYIASIVGFTVTMSQPAITTLANSDFSASGAVIEISANPSVDGTGPLALVGGSKSAPLWGAGDTAINHLPSVPVGVGQMNGRAWFAAGLDGIPFSDSLQPCVRTNATQALLPGNGLPVTAIGPLMLQTPISGGIVIAIIAFQDASAMQQIQGDPATGNLQMNPLPVQTGTFAPNSICTSSKGLFFVSPEGLRLIDFQANVSDPIGQDGEGVVTPFLQVYNPPSGSDPNASRICACAGGRTLRIDVPLQDGTTANYWFDLTRRIWTGPHTGSAHLCRTWRDWMLITPIGRPSLIQQQSDEQHPGCVFVENGAVMDVEWETCLMPDNGEAAMNTLVESTLMVALMPNELVQVMFLDEVRTPVDGVTISGLVVDPALWGQMILGQTFTGPDPGSIRQRAMNWSIPVVFKQGSLNIRALASRTLVIGNWYARFEVTSYILEVPQIPASPLSPGDFLLSDDGVTILQAEITLTNLRPG